MSTAALLALGEDAKRGSDQADHLRFVGVREGGKRPLQRRVCKLIAQQRRCLDGLELAREASWRAHGEVGQDRSRTIAMLVTLHLVTPDVSQLLREP